MDDRDLGAILVVEGTNGPLNALLSPTRRTTATITDDTIAFIFRKT